MQTDLSTLFLYWVVGVSVGWAIFYYTIKAAVKNGMIEARRFQPINNTTSPERPANAKQKELQEKYDKGEIKFEEYQKEWEKAKNN